MHLLQRLLKIRNEFDTIFTEGNYVPLKTGGEFANNVFAFMRTHETGSLLVAIPLQYAQIRSHDTANLLDADWGNTILEVPKSENGTWRNLLSENSSPIQSGITVQELFKQFPAAVLHLQR